MVMMIMMMTVSRDCKMPAAVIIGRSFFCATNRLRKCRLVTIKFFLVFLYFFPVFVPCAGLSWPYRQLLNACKYIVSYRIVSKVEWTMKPNCCIITHYDHYNTVLPWPNSELNSDANWRLVLSLEQKNNEQYYRYVLMMQELLSAIRSIAGDAFVFQQDNTLAHSARDTVKLFAPWETTVHHSWHVTSQQSWYITASGAWCRSVCIE